MGFMHATAPIRARNDELLSADNKKPDRFTLMDTVRRAAKALRLGPPVIATLDTLLSCLPPSRSHDVVFASNATLVMRRNGISDRTLRRHLAELVDAGLLSRVDSPNGKRYSKRDSLRGTVLRFGLDLAPLFASFAKLRALARKQTMSNEQNAYLRSKLRMAIHLSLSANHDVETALEAQKALRRKLANEALETWLEKLEMAHAVREGVDGMKEMSVSNSQNVRHQQKSKKELKDKKEKATEKTTEISLEDLTDACPQATEFLPEGLTSPLDVITHARRLAPMIGIDAFCYEAAEAKLGTFGTALTIWALLEMQDKVLKLGAYFRAITTGQRSATFDPCRLIKRLAITARQKLSADNTGNRFAI